MWKTAMFVTVFGGAVLQWKTVSAVTVCSQMGCDFESNLCNWSSSKGNGYSLQWKRSERWFGTDYAHLDFEEQGSGSKGRLFSPSLDSQPGHSCQLQFKYFLLGSGCQLSVFLTTEDSTLPRKLWNTTQPAGDVNIISTSFSDYQHASFSCSLDTSYKIYFEGERLDGTAYACGSKAEIDLDDISCSATATTTTHTKTSSTSVTTPAGTSASVSTDGTSSTAMLSSAAATTASSDVVSSTPASYASVSSDSSVNGSNNADQMGDKGQGLSVGSVAGIVIAMVLVIAFVISIVIFMIRRRQMKDDKSASDSHIYINTGGVMEESVTAVSNAAFRPSDTVHGSANHHHSPSNHNQLADNSDTYNHLAMGAQPTTTHDHSKGDKQATQDAYAVPHKQKAAKTSATKTTATINNHKPTAPDHNDDYNHLGNQNLPQPSVLDVDYSHLGEPSTPEALYSNVGQQSPKATPEYSLAKDVAVSSSLNQSSDVYELASMPGDVKKAMMSSPADDYHHAVDLKGEKKTAGIADHLHNYDHVQDPAALNEDGYNNLDRDQAKSRDQQRNMAADDYSHV